MIVMHKTRTALAAAVAATALAATAAPPADAARNLASCGSYMVAWNYWTREWFNAYMAAGEVVTPYVSYASRMANDAMDDWNNNNCA